MSTRSTTPLTSCSIPMGISVATTCGPKEALGESRVRKKSARSRSSMFTKTTRATSSSSARCHRRLVETSTPMTALTTKTAASHTRRDPRASATKLGSPGVSMRLILRSCHSKEFSAAPIDIWRDCSSASASETVLPSATEPSRLVAPAWNSRASCREVFPLPRWPTSATLRMRSALLCMTFLLPSTDGRPDPTPPPRSGLLGRRDRSDVAGVRRAVARGDQPVVGRRVLQELGRRGEPDRLGARPLDGGSPDDLVGRNRVDRGLQRPLGLERAHLEVLAAGARRVVAVPDKDAEVVLVARVGQDLVLPRVVERDRVDDRSVDDV